MQIRSVSYVAVHMSVLPGKNRMELYNEVRVGFLMQMITPDILKVYRWTADCQCF